MSSRLRLTMAALAGLMALWSCASAELRLPVKYHHQEHALSCEAAALQMVLSYYGLSVTEATILEKMPFDRTPRGNGLWGDPDVAFVGNVDGEMGSDGYGIHAPGLGRVSSRWRKTDVIENGRLDDLVFHLSHRRPIVIWGYYESRDAVRWRTPSGRIIAGLRDEHARVVYGFRGPAGMPTEFLLMDPQNGPLVWSRDALLENWDSLGRSAIVVYDEVSAPAASGTAGSPGSKNP